MEFVFIKAENVNYSKAAKKHLQMKLHASLNLTHVILVQTNTM